MFKHNLTAVLNMQRISKAGTHALRIRSTINRKVSYYPTGIMLKQIEWDCLNKKVILHSQRNLLNSEINRVMAALETDFVKQNLNGETAPVIIKEKSKDFYKYIQDKIKANKSKRSTSTTLHHLSYLNKLKEFKTTLLFAEINEKLLSNFEDHCRAKGNINNTVWSASKFFKTYIHAAMREGFLNYDPIKNFEGTPYIEPGRMYLTAEEIERIEVVALDVDTYRPYRNAANWFLFSCYSGLRYQDVANFTKDSIVNDKLILKTSKTGETVTIALHPRLRAVIGRVETKLTTNQDYNRNLKAVAQLAKIKKPMTSHIGRHTMAVNWLDDGGSIETLSKILGHASLKTTSIYGKITNKRIDNEIEKVWGK